MSTGNCILIVCAYTTINVSDCSLPKTNKHPSPKPSQSSISQALFLLPYLTFSDSWPSPDRVMSFNVDLSLDKSLESCEELTLGLGFHPLVGILAPPISVYLSSKFICSNCLASETAVCHDKNEFYAKLIIYSINYLFLDVRWNTKYISSVVNT